MQLELTNEQYRRLVTLVFLGEWIANGSSLDERRQQQLQDVAGHVYALADQFGADDWIQYCSDCQLFHANQTMEEELRPMVESYDEETFWDVLSHHLAHRDIMVNHEPAEELSLEMEMRLRHRKEQYEQEFLRNGLDHVRLVFHGGKKRG